MKRTSARSFLRLGWPALALLLAFSRVTAEAPPPESLSGLLAAVRSAGFWSAHWCLPWDPAQGIFSGLWVLHARH